MIFFTTFYTKAPQSGALLSFMMASGSIESGFLHGYYMAFENDLMARKEELAEKWADLVLSTYPAETQKVWKNQKDRFQNPVGASIHEATEVLFTQILNWDEANKIAQALDQLIRIRAVQNFSPSQAVNFVFLLKKLLRDEFFSALERTGELSEFMRFEAKIDNVAMMAFDIYCKSREEIYRLRVDEVKRSQSVLLKRAKMIVDDTTDTVEK